MITASVFSLASCNFGNKNNRKEEVTTTETLSEPEESSSEAETEDESIYSEGLEYVMNRDGKSYSCIGKGSCKSKKIIIPATYNSLPVTEIGTLRVSGHAKWYGVEILIIADGERIVNIDTFVSHQSLKELYIGSGVTLNERAFVFCSALETVYISENVTINRHAFMECNKLNSVYLSEQTVLNGTGIFYCCTNLQNVTLPPDLKILPASTFKKCSSLTNITIPDTVTSIGHSAFASCGKLEYVFIPRTVVMIDYDILYNTYLEELNYGGTMEQWEKINKAENWALGSSVKRIICTDGVIELNPANSQ